MMEETKNRREDMSDLKTLKDIDFSKLEFREKRASEYLIENIKAEAVKWVKKFEESPYCGSYIGEINWIKEFFNLEEEDLK